MVDILPKGISITIFSTADMKSKLTISPLILSMILWYLPAMGFARHGSCASVPSVQVSPDPRIYFKAKGTFPNWTLSVSELQISFQSEDVRYPSFTSPHVDPVKAQDANIRTYSVHTEAGMMEVELAQMLCMNEGSKERFPYSVTVRLKNNIDTAFTTFTGCGQYVTDEKLQEFTWVLDSIKHEAVGPQNFRDTLPWIEIKANGNSFKGYGGCNTFTGRLYAEHTLLRFTDFVIKKEVCTPTNREAEVLNGLRFTTQYRFENGKLILANPSGTTLVFRRKE